MIQLDLAKSRLRDISSTADEVYSALNIDDAKKEHEELNLEMAAPGFWDDMDRAQDVNKRIKALENKIKSITKVFQSIEDCQVMIEMCRESDDEELYSELDEELNVLAEKCEELRLETLLTGEYDSNNAFLSLNAGAGGTEAQDWNDMLFRMYKMYCERHGYSVEVMDYLSGNEAGIKSVTFLVSGENAYGFLKAEKGVHRLVRISPFDSNARRHTSFASLDVMPEIESSTEVDINQDDLRIDTYRSSGAGGQHINKTDSAVRITHIPTGIVASCQNERSQVQNKETAMKMLISKLVEVKERENMEKLADIKGEMKKIEWGSQIRSYVFHPYKMVKDHRTNAETGNVDAVMDGNIDLFITAYLKMI
ncbi:MAG: peptide chain release factor 2 [Clostridia bacterium]|nr:peptide chain release factor 2 [Clostridia bacterium]